MQKALLLAVFCCVALLTGAPVVVADTLDDRLAFWESQAFYCVTPTAKFPSKEGSSSTNNPTGCDDGDMTLFNGLLCASGDERGCAAVKASQGPDGRWWRSPRRIGMDSSNGNDVSFSPDQALGVMLYAVQKGDAIAFRGWMHWMDANRPCILSPFGNCLLGGWPRFCTDDADKRCTLRPGNCATLESVGSKLGVSEGAICKRVLSQFQISTDFVLPEDKFAAGAALLNDPGYPMHLAGAEILLLEKASRATLATRLAAISLSLREPKNPFFLYLAVGPTQEVTNLVLDRCPSPGRPSNHKSQWSWERADGDKAWLDSMYWDCISMAHLLGR